MREEDLETQRVHDEAMSRIDELVEEALENCDTIADVHHYERTWVRDEFRARFNQAKQKSQT